MRTLLLLLIPALAQADVRVEAHVAGGMEGGTIQGVARPDGVGELGLGAAWFARERNVGVMLVGDRVERLSAEVSVASEQKLDLLVCFRAKQFVFGFGGGIRKLEVAAEQNGKPSTVWGVDLLRYQFDAHLARVGPVGIGFYFAWTLGLYQGEVYGTRSGDMPYPTRDLTTFANSYVLGLQTTFDTRN